MTKQWSDSISLSELFRIIRLRKAIIFIILALTVLSTVLVTYTLPKWYRATTNIRVEKPDGTVSLFRPNSAGTYDPYFINEQFEIIQSRIILLPVLEEFNIPELLEKQLGGRVSLDTAYTYFVRNMLQVKSQAGTSLIDISVEVKEDPELAARIANSIARTYAENRIAFASGGQLDAIADLRKALEEQEAAVSRQRDEVERLRKEYSISGIEMNRQGPHIEIETLRQLERTLISMKVELIARKTRWERFRDVEPEKRINLINAESVNDSNIQNLLQAYLLSEQNFHAVQARLGENHPDFLQSKANVEKIRSQLDGLLDGYVNSLESSYKEAEARVAELEKQIEAAQQAQILSSSRRIRPFEEAATKLRDEEQLLQAFRLRLKQSEIDFQVPKRSIEILNEAVPVSRPSKPNWLLNVLLALIVGGLLGTGTAFTMEFFDSSFRSVEELEHKLGLPIYGVVPRDHLLIDEKTASDPRAEAYRVVQTNLELHKSTKNGALVFTFQSAGPGEGKSSLLHNVAVLEALSGLKVLIVDTDTRRPIQHDLFGIKKSPGLLDYLSHSATLENLPRQTPIDNLEIVTAGTGNAGSSPHLAKQHIEAILSTYAKHYDRIFLDSPPVIGISDSSLIASMVDGVVFVVQHKRNPQSMTTRAQSIIKHSGGNILGVVLNQVPLSGSEDYNYYTGNYSYYKKSRREQQPKERRSGTEDPFQLEDTLTQKNSKKS